MADLWPVATVSFVPHLNHDETDDGQQRTNIFLQYKNTDICFDFWCECGYQGHFDGYFASSVQCPKCDKVYVLPCTIFPLEHDGTTYQHRAVIPTDDDE